MRFAVIGGVAASLFVSFAVMSVRAQTPSERVFDPARPFAGVTAPQQWTNRFATGKPTFDAYDSFAGFTARDWNNQGFYGNYAGRPEATPLTVIGMPSQDRAQARASTPSGGTGVVIRSPYPYKNAQEHYDAWLKGRRPAAKPLPDWSGDWAGLSRAQGLLDRKAKISDTLEALTPEYRDSYRDILYAQWKGHTWEPLEFCLPRHFAVEYGGGTWHFMMNDHLVLLNGSTTFDNITRYVYTDDRGFLPEDAAKLQWHGEAVGFWDNDELVIYTKNIRGWMFGTTLPEYSDEMQTVERWKRFGNQMLVDITFYDPVAFNYPWHDVSIFRIAEDWTAEPATLDVCAATNNVYMDAKGDIVSHEPGEVGYVNMALNPRPWAAAVELWDKAHPELAAQWAASLKRNDDAAKAGKGYVPK